METILPGAESFFLPGGAVGCLLLHGLTGSPFEMRELGVYLNQRGYTISGPRLAGHATYDWKDLANNSWHDWYRTVSDAYDELTSRCTTIYLIGLSSGGAFALYHCAKSRTDVPPAGCVVMATPIFLYSGLQISMIKLLSLFVPYRLKGESRIKDPEAQRTHVTGLHRPLKTGVAYHQFLAQLRPLLSEVYQPSLLIYSRLDPTVPISNGEYIFDKIGTSNKRFVKLENSYHILTRDFDKSVVFEEVGTFLAS